MSTTLEKIAQAVIEGESEEAAEGARQALAEGTDPQAVFREALVPAMEIVGKKMQAAEYYIPEVLMSARAMKTAAAVLRPAIEAQGEIEPTGRVIFGTIRGDLHDIGKNLVSMMLIGAGFQVTDLGSNVSSETFVEKALELKPDIVAMSALLTTTMVGMRDVVQGLKAVGCRDAVKVMIGGAPVTPRFAEEIGADGYAPEAVAAVELARQMVHK